MAGLSRRPQPLRAGLRDNCGLVWTNLILPRIRRLEVRVPPRHPSRRTLSELGLCRFRATAASAAAITSAPAAAATFGAVFGFTITTSGYPLPRISKSGTLPPGVHLAGNGDGTANHLRHPRPDRPWALHGDADRQEQGRRSHAVLHPDRLEGAGHRQGTGGHRHDRHADAPGRHRRQTP
jgi:hypothetical protein